MIITCYVYVNDTPLVQRAYNEMDKHGTETANDADPEFGLAEVLWDCHPFLGGKILWVY